MKNLLIIYNGIETLRTKLPNVLWKITNPKVSNFPELENQGYLIYNEAEQVIPQGKQKSSTYQINEVDKTFTFDLIDIPVIVQDIDALAKQKTIELNSVIGIILEKVTLIYTEQRITPFFTPEESTEFQELEIEMAGVRREAEKNIKDFVDAGDYQDLMNYEIQSPRSDEFMIKLQIFLDKQPPAPVEPPTETTP